MRSSGYSNIVLQELPADGHIVGGIASILRLFTKGHGFGAFQYNNLVIYDTISEGES
jgi:hypothetical protein